MAAFFTRFLALAASLAVSSSATTIAEINGPKFLSPLKDQAVSNVSGIITAKGPDGLWLRSIYPDRDERTSESLYVFGRAFGANLTVGDSIVVRGQVAEYRNNKDYLYLTQLSRPVLEKKVSSGTKVQPLVIGKDTRDPPTEQYSSLDGGDVFAVPNNVSLISVANPELQPKTYGLDFWESLSGELVTVQKPTALTKANRFGDTWVAGNWKVSGRNDRDGLTITDKDANPEAIIIGTPLDGTKNPTSTRMGDSVEEITGIVSYAFGFYRILPTTAIKITDSQKQELPKPTKLESKGRCSGITIGAYNVENLAPNSSHHGAVAEHIIKYLRSPDIIFVQEVQDDNGPTNDAIVSANLTLTTLTAAIKSAGGPAYTFTDIVPVDDQDGGQPGGNIRVAYLYKPELIRLYKPNPGGSLDANEVLNGPTLKYNPGRIDPANKAWTASRKPLAAQWEVISKKSSASKADTFFTVNVHFGSKGGSSSLHGDARPPVNGGVADRLAQAQITANFIKNILAKDKDARIITAGDFNEFAFVEPLEQYAQISGLKDLDAVAKIDKLERYTYLFDMNAQQLDHMFVSDSVAKSGEAKYEHIHLNTWPELASQVSDHDPSVARLDVCA
ncbi:endonuclease/exonuclease/phosphatase family protein-like protein [Cucurbitaria berberidis CBS 394.84]|uniref:Endonuclease/exonuclease/phosphatase family protein-like protein n=1 Tax=Cucurbitaria berberidis CBS 394.84 TaxID=1168544 RepID=A0A9P4GSU6_9PLEO|nr:endonuclease/exonuclease/phosphatase family protein-like protein [Cucurbitaria berberidis CBS 394.84]KAF1850692.1 endonuclease/exonuclease/phosphatase family protein-like protein [Cucurbitaria berberidis CBS 394.84]